MNIKEKNLSYQNVYQAWMEWENHPLTLLRRKMVIVKSEIKGQPDQNVPGIGQIIFAEHFLDFLAKWAEQKNTVEKTYNQVFDKEKKSEE